MKKVIYSIVAIVIGVIFFYSFQGGNSPEAYAREIEQERKDLERYLKESKESPFVTNNVAFKKLNFFPPDINFRVQASLKKIQTPRILDIKTSDGKDETFETYASLDFQLDGKRMSLTALKPTSDLNYNELFIPFGDLTNGEETYGAGRYLEIDFQKGSSSVELDFNKASNPYCAYVPSYSCPLPPPSNRLKIAIPVGEKTYEE